MNSWPFKKYITARAIIIQDEKLLVFHRKRFDRNKKWIEYYSLPGGQIDPGETPETAVVRELQEEMGVDIRLHGLVAHSKELVFEHYIFSADIVTGDPHLVSGSEESERASEHNRYEVLWVEIETLSAKDLKFYSMFYEHIVALSQREPLEQVAKLPVTKRVY